jgi:hypothetical protein
MSATWSESKLESAHTPARPLPILTNNAVVRRVDSGCAVTQDLRAWTLPRRGLLESTVRQIGASGVSQPSGRGIPGNLVFQEPHFMAAYRT